MARDAVLVIPCYNEASRLDFEEVRRLVEHPRVRVLFVDDGSQDATREVIQEHASARPDALELLALPENVGKAEAVRRGLLRGIEGGAAAVGYADADFATPAREITRLLGELSAQDALVIMGSRMARLGSRIHRSPVRHIAGRVFATFASVAVGQQVYDTQCGAKWFRVNESLRAVLSVPFLSRWSFDVELLCRFFGRQGTFEPIASERIIEVPLLEWRDVPGSSLGVMGMARAFGDVVMIATSALVRSEWRRI